MFNNNVKDGLETRVSRVETVAIIILFKPAKI